MQRRKFLTLTGIGGVLGVGAITAFSNESGRSEPAQGPLLESVEIVNKSDENSQFVINIIYEGDSKYNTVRTIMNGKQTVINNEWPQRPGVFTAVGFSHTHNNMAVLSFASGSRAFSGTENIIFQFTIEPTGDVNGDRI